MIEVHPRLFVGSQEDEPAVRGNPDWYIVHAAREPYHRRAVGYTGRGAPKDHPEYLVAKRPGEMMMNLLDPEDVAYIPPELMNAALSMIGAQLANGKKVLVHCNQGHSRGPTIALLYLRRTSADYADLTHEHGAAMFWATYPAYAPAKGMALYAEQHWNDRVA